MTNDCDWLIVLFEGRIVGDKVCVEKNMAIGRLEFGIRYSATLRSPKSGRTPCEPRTCERRSPVFGTLRTANSAPANSALRPPKVK